MSGLSPKDTHDSMDKQYEAGGKYQAEQIEQELGSPTSAEPTKGSKIKRHCARFWWLHLITFCVVFLVVALLLVYVGMPRIAQKGVDDSSIEITDIEFRNPASTSLVLTQKAILHSPSIFTPTFDPFPVSLYLVTNGTKAAVPMLDLPMPQIHALHPQSNVSVDSAFAQINSLEQVTAYATAVMTQENVTVALSGRTKLHVGALPVNSVNFNKTVTYKGLNGLKGFNVTGARINLTAPAGTPNLRGFAFVPNPSLLTIEMGNVTLILSTAKAGVVGNSTIENMTLVPGDNSLPMTAIINQTLVTSSLDANGFVNMEIIGNSSVSNGQHLTYYEQALASNKLSLSMNVLQILKDSAAAATA